MTIAGVACRSVVPGLLSVLLLLLASPSLHAQGAELDPNFDDRPLVEPLEEPSWFKLSFLDLQDDLDEAIAAGRRGIVIYFGQKYCPYCKALIENNWGRPDIVAYTRQHFDVVALNVRGNRLVTDFDGRVLSEKEYAAKMGATFTPTLLFIDDRAQIALKLVGYYAPYEFRAALEYVAGGHHRQEPFRDYLARADMGRLREEGELNGDPLFEPPPYSLDRSRFAAQQPLVVVFEQSDCWACDVLHAGPLADATTRALLEGMQVVQLDIWAETPVITPAGKRTTARRWAEKLGLFYTPTLIFYDPHGREVIRVDSVAFANRLRNVVRYVAEGGYLHYPSFQEWRAALMSRLREGRE